jgi:hypothetical protein
MSVTGNIGNEQVELTNAATEDTLKQLLATMKTMNQSILKTSSVSGTSSGATTANAAATQLGVSLTRLNPAVAAVQAGFNILSNMVSGLANRVGFVAGAFVNFATQAMQGTATMSSFYGALSQVTSAIPLLGGVLGPIVGLFQKMAEFQEANMSQYQRLTAVGINFGGSLTNLRMAASNAYMTLDDFGRLMSENSKTFAKMGGTVNTGAEAFSRMSNTIMKSFGPELTAMGYTTAQVNQGLASYIEMTGGRGAAEIKNTGAIIASSAAYMEQLNGLAEITGKSREAQVEEMKRQASNAAFEAKMQGMSEKEKEKAMAGLAFALATGGKGAAEAFQAEVMGVGPTTKAAQQYTAMYSEAAAGQRRSAQMVTDSTKSRNDMENQYMANRRAQLRDSDKYGEQQKYAMTTMNGAYGQQMQETESATNTMRKQTEESVRAALEKKRLQDTEASVMANANLALKDFGSMVMGFLTPVIAAFTPLMGKIIESFKEFMKTVDLPGLGKQLGVLAKHITEYIQNVFSPAGRDKIVNDLKYYLQLIMIEIKKAIIPWYTESDAGKDKGKLDAEKAMIDKTAAQTRLKGKALEEENAAIDKRLAATKKTTDLAESTSTGEKAGAWAGAIGGAGSGAYMGTLAGPLGVAIGALTGALIGAVAGSGVGGDIGKWFASSSPTPEKRNTGSLGKTGNLFENFGSGTPVELHGSESVLTPDQMAKLVTNAVTASQNNNLQASIQQLNSLTKDMLTVMKESSENIKRNVAATKSLNRNLFPT